jgi:hypothetical protein
MRSFVSASFSYRTGVLARAEPRPARTRFVITRFLILLTCASGLFWAYHQGSTSLFIHHARKLSLRILDGHTYPVPQLDYQIQRFQNLKTATCQGDLERSLAIMMLNRYELSGHDGALVSKLRGQLYAALSCHPGDGYLWLAETWLRNQLDSEQGSAAAALALSFEFAPREGWIVRRRLPLSLNLFETLPKPLQDKAVQDFANLVEYSYFTEAVNAVTSIDKITAQRLLEGLAPVSYERMRIFSRMLYRVDPFLTIPGFSHGLRPWQM